MSSEKSDASRSTTTDRELGAGRSHTPLVNGMGVCIAKMSVVFMDITERLLKAVNRQHSPLPSSSRSAITIWKN